MKNEEVINVLKNTFKEAILGVTFQFGETSVEVKAEALNKILSFLKYNVEPAYLVLMDLTGVDYLHPIAGTRLIYWLHNPTNFQRIRITLFAKREEVVPSICSIWEGANWYERELYDLFGVSFKDHPDLKRILMPEDWIGHPLRKDYALTEESVEFKHGVKPKIPSEIIHVKQDQKLIPP